VSCVSVILMVKIMQHSGNPMRVFLARHGESEANLQKLISGQLDVPLTEKGINQSYRLRDVLINETLTAIYASSLIRTIETARPTAESHGIEIKVMDQLKEKHFGILQGRSIEADFAGNKHKIKPENEDNDSGLNGETYEDFSARIGCCLDTILAEQIGDILVVGHRKTNEIILSKLLSLDMSGDVRINVKNKYLYVITLGDKQTVNTIRLGGEFHGKKFEGLKDD
jgi:broad specificity phosphatase PhoE